MKIHVKRKNDECIVLLLRHKGTDIYSFVNITKGHICPCKFNGIEEGIADLERNKLQGAIIDYTIEEN